MNSFLGILLVIILFLPSIWTALFVRIPAIKQQLQHRNRRLLFIALCGGLSFLMPYLAYAHLGAQVTYVFDNIAPHGMKNETDPKVIYQDEIIREQWLRQLVPSSPPTCYSEVTAVCELANETTYLSWSSFLINIAIFSLSLLLNQWLIKKWVRQSIFNS